MQNNKTNPITVKELIQELKKFDPELPVIVRRDGNGHSYPVLMEEFKLIKHPYFPDTDWVLPNEEDNPDQDCLQMALI